MLQPLPDAILIGGCDVEDMIDSVDGGEAFMGMKKPTDNSEAKLFGRK
jgi:hypothetical protein